MIEGFLPRTISFEHDREVVKIDARTALADVRLEGRPIILLGEAGSGKSELLRQWGGGQVSTARQLINRWQPTQGRSFVDGLDEAAGLSDGDVLDRLLGELKAQRNSDFVIACRIADWRSASGVATIKAWTGVEPVLLTICPLGKGEILRFLRECKGLSLAAAEAFVTYYEVRGLNDWLGNPQTLNMLRCQFPGHPVFSVLRRRRVSSDCISLLRETSAKVCRFPSLPSTRHRSARVADPLCCEQSSGCSHDLPR